MKVNIELSKDYNPPHATIYTDEITDEVQQVVDVLNKKDVPFIGNKEDRMYMIKPEEIYMITIIDKKTMIYTQDDHYISKKRLYELSEHLGHHFMQISKQTIVNLVFIESIEASFNGCLLLKLKNGTSDYVSRKYLPALKRYLGL